MFKLLFPLLSVVKFEKLRLISTFLGNGALEGDSFYSVFLSPVRKINSRCSEFQMLLMCQNSLFKSKLLKLLFLNANFPPESMMSILKNWQFHLKKKKLIKLSFVQVTNQNQPQLHDGNKTIRINLSDEFTTALQGCLQESKWQGIDIRCSQKEEGTSGQGSNIQFPERSLHQRISSADRTLENPSSTPP